MNLTPASFPASLPGRLRRISAGSWMCVLSILVIPSLSHAETKAPPVADLLWLERLSYGVSDDSVAQLGKLGRKAYLEQQLNQNRADSIRPAGSEPIEQVLQRRQALQEEAKAKPAGPERRVIERGLRKESLEQARQFSEQWLTRAVESPQQLTELMAWFWFNHFNVYSAKADVGVMLADYGQAMRPHLLGNFKDLLRATVRHPAMLVYLDNVRSRQGNINENYARELLELHTLGVSGGYTQQDVQELARILTGLQVVRTNQPAPGGPHKADFIREGAFQFNPVQHDYGDKMFLKHRIEGKGWAEVDEAIDIMVTHPSTARFVARKLCQYFVSDNPSEELVTAAAKTFSDTRGEIKPVLRTIFASAEFEASLGKKYKTPFQYVVSAYRLGAQPMSPELSRNALLMAERLGERLHNRTTPDGFPLRTGEWAGPGQMAGRIHVARQIATGAVSGTGAPAVERSLALQLPVLGKVSSEAVSAQSSPGDAFFMLMASPEFMYR